MAKRSPDELTGANVKLHIADQDRRKALKAIADERTRLDRAAASHAKAKARFERTVAQAITSDPTRPDWYTRPGPLDPAQVREAAKLNPMQVHRIMDRQRKEARKKKKRTR